MLWGNLNPDWLHNWLRTCYDLTRIRPLVLMIFLLGGRPLTNIRNVSGPRSARLTPAKLAPTRRVYDCFLFNGEVDVLSIRLHELNRIVDVFVIVESNQTFSGAAREI